MWKIKDKEKFLKITREKKFLTYRGVRIRIKSDFSSESMQSRKKSEMHEMLKRTMNQDSESREIILQNWIRNRFFFQEKKLREFVERPVLQEVLKEILQKEEKL